MSVATDRPSARAGEHPPSAFLEVRDLRIHFPTDDGLVRAVDGISFRLDRGHSLGIVGESGSGKSVTSLGILGLHRRGGTRISGQIWLDGQELIGADPEEVRRALDWLLEAVRPLLAQRP